MNSPPVEMHRVAFARRRPIFLDFMSPDNRTMYGAYQNYSRSAHVAVLSKALDIALLLGDGTCILPPSFITQCALARAALKRRSRYMAAGVFQLPLREATLAEFFDKKQREYEHARPAYRGLYSRHGQVFVTEQAIHIVRRDFRVGLTVATRWEEGPDSSSAWRRILPGLDAAEVRALREAPRHLKERGVAVTAHAIRSEVKTRLTLADIDAILQQEYARLYAMRFDACVVANVPPKTFELDVAPPDASYDFRMFRAVLRPMNLWPTIQEFTPSALLRLRETDGFQQFIVAFESVCRVEDASAVRRIFITLAQDQRNAISSTARTIERLARTTHDEQVRELIDAVQSRMAAVVTAYTRTLVSPDTSMKGEGMSTKTQSRAEIGIIVALEKERDAVLGALRGDRASTSGHRSWYRWTIADGRRVVLACAGMGPLAAATVALDMITSERPAYLFLVGIAAGLHPDAALGDVIVADQIVDYEPAKETPDGTQHRWAVYRADPQILAVARHVRSSWSDRLTQVRPDGDSRRRSGVHIGRILSGAKVIADAAFTNELRQVWADARGLEMEATGVAAAVYAASAGTEAPRLGIFKAVSDRADVAKDDRWQGYASVAAAEFLSEVVIALGSEPAGRLDSPAAEYVDIPRRPRPAAESERYDALALQLEPILSTRMNLAELEQLAFRAGIEWEEIPGQVRSTKVIGLLKLAGRHRKLDRLLGELRRSRPDLVDELL